MRTQSSNAPANAGFSLIELLIAMAVTLVVMTIASTLIVSAFNIRARENQRSEAMSDAQRALNIMSREIANSGYGLSGNGIVPAESNLSSIRVRANLNASWGETTSDRTSDRDEDVRYLLYSDGTSSYIVRLDINTGAQTAVLANRVDSLTIRYYAQRVNYTPNANTCDIDTGGIAEVTDKRNAKYVVVMVCVTLPERGRPGAPGYQPVSRTQLVSDVTLRNADLVNY